jgi:hypothetical protein
MIRPAANHHLSCLGTAEDFQLQALVPERLLCGGNVIVGQSGALALC